VNTWTGCAGQCVGRASNILWGGPAKCGDRHFPTLGGDGSDSIEVAFRGNRETRFNYVNAKFLKLHSHPNFLAEVHRTAG
jgi:hypothetical protein